MPPLSFANRRVESIRMMLAASIAACAPFSVDLPSAIAQDQEGAVVGRRGMIVAVSPEGADVGLSVLKRGGTAVDASVATAFAMAVTYPSAGNIGGGGFMMVHPSDGRPPVCIEYRERAPGAAARDMFPKGASRLGPKVVGVPGTVRGMALAHQRFGKLPWKDLVMPAVGLAEEGFVLGERLAGSLNRLVRTTPQFPELARVFGKAGSNDEWQAGDRLVQPDLGRTLRRIAEQGPADFYDGKTAELLAAEMKVGGGLITKEDLSNYRANVRRPIHTTFRGHDVYGPPPPSSGGTCLALMLNTLENFDLASQGRFSPQTMHLIAETMRRTYSDRAKHLGDADYVAIPPRLTTKTYAKKVAAGIDRGRATPSETLAPPIQLAQEGSETTHFSVIDSTGMAVSNTYTLEQGYGSRVVVKGAGFLLNNEMIDFNWRPGVTDRKGAIGTEANQIAPGKRMLSSQTPTIVARDGKVVLVTGSPGGRTIINTSLCMVLNVLEFGMSIRQAVDAPRMDHEWFPDRIRFEGADDPAHASMVRVIRAMGHTVQRSRQGDAHSIFVRDGTYYGAADHRIRGKASGY